MSSIPEGEFVPWMRPSPEGREPLAERRGAVGRARNIDANDLVKEHGPRAVVEALESAAAPLIRPGSLAEHGKSTEETLAREWVGIHLPDCGSTMASAVGFIGPRVDGNWTRLGWP